MLTTTELAVTATIWAMTAAGGFFGIRAAIRKRKVVNKQRDIRPPR